MAKILFLLCFSLCFLLVDGAQATNFTRETVLLPNVYYNNGVLVLYENEVVTLEEIFYNIQEPFEVKWVIRTYGGRPKPFHLQEDLRPDANQIISKFTMNFTRDVEKVVCKVTADGESHSYVTRFRLVQPSPPIIERNGNILNDDSNLVEDNERISLTCNGGGVGDLNITWLDSTGLPLHPGDAIEIGELEKYQLKGKHPRGSRSLDFTAERGMTAMGCQLNKKYYSHPIVRWFNFTVPLTATLITEQINSTGFRFTCQTNVIDKSSIDYHWIINGNTSHIGGESLIINPDEMKLEHVYCSVSDPYGSAESELDLPNPSVNWFMVLTLIGGIIILVSVAIFFGIKRYLLTKSVPTTKHLFFNKEVIDDKMLAALPV